MRTAITGATGFIGSALVRELTENDHAVIALSRNPDRVGGRFPSGVQTARWDPAGSEPSPKCDALIHLAGESVSGRWTAEKKKAIRDSRVLGTRALVDAIERMPQRPSVLLCASGIGYYGDRGDEILTESSSPGDGFLAEVCQEWEAEARRAENLGVRVALFRTGMVLDKEGGGLREMAPLFRMGVGGRLGSGRQWVSWIHRGDIAALYRHVLERNDLSGPILAVSPEPVRNAEFARSLGAALHRPAVLPAPSFALKLVLGEFANAVLGGQRALPNVALESGFQFRYPRLDDALAAIYR